MEIWFLSQQELVKQLLLQYVHICLSHDHLVIKVAQNKYQKSTNDPNKTRLIAQLNLQT